MPRASLVWPSILPTGPCFAPVWFDPSIGSNGPSPAPVSFDLFIGPNGPCPAPALGRIPKSTNWVSTATTHPAGLWWVRWSPKIGCCGWFDQVWLAHKTGGPGNCRGGAWGRRRQTGFDGQTVPRNKAQGQTPHRGCLRWCLVVILFSFRKKIDSGYIYRVYGVLAGSSRTTFAGAHVVQGEGGYGVTQTLSSIQTTMWCWRVLDDSSGV